MYKRQAAKTKVAVTRKHLRRDQAAARKARSNALPGSDSIKERQLKEEREAKRATLDSRHQYLFSAVATKLRIGENDVEEYILDGDQLRYIEDFFVQNGSKCLLFYYEETRGPPAAEGD